MRLSPFPKRNASVPFSLFPELGKAYLLVQAENRRPPQPFEFLLPALA